MSNIAQRLKSIIEEYAPERGRFSSLEQWSGIDADSWKSFFYMRQRPTQEMIQFSCRRWPQYALWICSGLTDAAHGHIAHISHHEEVIDSCLKTQQSTNDYLLTQAQLCAKREQGDFVDEFDIYELAQRIDIRRAQILANQQMIKGIELDFIGRVSADPAPENWLSDFVLAFNKLCGSHISASSMSTSNSASWVLLARKMGMYDLANHLKQKCFQQTSVV